MIVNVINVKVLCFGVQHIDISLDVVCSRREVGYLGRGINIGDVSQAVLSNFFEENRDGGQPGHIL